MSHNETIDGTNPRGDASPVSSIDTVPVKLKWSKRVYDNVLSIRPGSLSDAFKEEVRALTGVPPERQKLLCRGAWKGPLPDGTPFGTADEIQSAAKKGSLAVTLIGSADAAPEAPKERTRFVEDVTPEERAAAEAEAEARAAESAEGMITAIQRPPLHRRDDDGKAGMYQYNRMVTGLPQRQMEDLLRERRTDAEASGEGEGVGGGALRGEVVMTLGLELRRAYVNDLAVLPDGTLVSGLDDSHVQLWRHGELVEDVVHEGVLPGVEGGVEALASFPSRGLNSGGTPDAAFASGGRACVRIWTAEGECMGAFPFPAGTTPNPIVAMDLGEGTNSVFAVAAGFRVTRSPNPGAFALAPADEEGRRRRAQAQAEEVEMQRALFHTSCSVRVWIVGPGALVPAGSLFTLEPNGSDVAAPVSSMAVVSDQYGQFKSLVCGDQAGGLRLWECDQTRSLQWNNAALLRLCSHEPAAGTVSVICMEPLDGGLLAVSTDIMPPQQAISQEGVATASNVALPIPVASAVFIVDVLSRSVNVVLNGHKDAVRCMCPLPGGGLATGGGKLDATVRIWGKEQVCASSSQHKNNEGEGKEENSKVPQAFSDSAVLEKMGFVFALKSIPDSKPMSKLFALLVHDIML
eukprot:CAMPEP_0183291630 /NCGR_PEP_ID=MMETSP0160_2-20130417/980_1 /TAXON_ID=2839 ORGANISM="Odontella Sinensis, Strain Grunow 1884" /NCGR_SAMPLE_ID=MMETSP0160_2 /ASSEMBLY_ACC=CAM_ASM_000250 /LENGTH=632 /DNA_ID=CAMNT_0025452463 /DNA_START=15 /DNA_END=1914 /DNA_ORIENTATION=+